jgi:AraC family transcriptional regulator
MPLRQQPDEANVAFAADNKWPAPGLEVERLVFPRGVVETPAAPRHFLSMHVGEPIRVDCSCDGARYRGWQSPGRIDLTPAGARGRWEDADEAKVILVSIAPSLLANSARELGVNLDRMVLAPQFQTIDPQLRHIIWALALAAESWPQTEPLLVDGLARALSARLISAYTGSPLAAPRQQELSPRQRRRVLDFIEANLAEKITLADIAREAGIGCTHLKVLFKRSMGIPVHQYVIQRRVEAAAQLIKENACSLGDIAAAAGFAHQSHMARCMRRVLGVTPSMLARARE